MKKTFEVAILTELYPMSKIDIFVEVLQSDGGNNSYVYLIIICLVGSGYSSLIIFMSSF